MGQISKYTVMMKTQFPTLKEIVSKQKKCQPHNTKKMRASIFSSKNLADNISVK